MIPKQIPKFESWPWRKMLMTIPKGCKITYGAYDKDIKKIISHNDSLKNLIKEHPGCVYGIAIVKK